MSDTSAVNSPIQFLELLNLLADTLVKVDNEQDAETTVLHALSTMFPVAQCDYLERDRYTDCTKIKATISGCECFMKTPTSTIPSYVFSRVDASQSPYVYQYNDEQSEGATPYISIITSVGRMQCYGFLILSGISNFHKDSSWNMALCLATSLFTCALNRITLNRSQRNALGTLLNTLDEFTKEPNIFLQLGQRLAGLAEQLKAKSASLWSYNPEQKILIYTASFNGKLPTPGPSEPEHAVIDIAQIEIQWRIIATQGKPEFWDNLPRKSTIPAALKFQMQDSERLLLVPMLTGSYIAGLITFSDPDLDAESLANNYDLLHQADQLGLGMQLHRLTRQNREVALLKERNRMAREIHDTLAQGFTGIIMWLEAARLNLPDNPQTAVEHLLKAKGVARDSLTEAHRSIWALRPSILQEYDLPQAIPQLADRLTRDVGHDVCFVLHGSAREIPARCEEALLKIAQEAITNVIRHADANMIRIELEYLKRSIRLQISDNGCGLKSLAEQSVSGFGMTSMRERAEQVGGTFSISNKAEGGVLTKVEIPV